MWMCNDCHNVTEKPEMLWAYCYGQRVDLIDMLCPNCYESNFTWLGTPEEKEKWWADQYAEDN